MATVALRNGREGSGSWREKGAAQSGRSAFGREQAEHHTQPARRLELRDEPAARAVVLRVVELPARAEPVLELLRLVLVVAERADLHREHQAMAGLARIVLHRDGDLHRRAAGCDRRAELE